MYLEEYEDLYHDVVLVSPEKKDTEASKEVLRKIYDYLRNATDCIYRLERNYFRVDGESYSLFYIRDMALFRYLLRHGLYLALVHEIYDFLRYKVMEDNLEGEPLYLPGNIREAMIKMLESEGKEWIETTD